MIKYQLSTIDTNIQYHNYLWGVREVYIYIRGGLTQALEGVGAYDIWSDMVSAHPTKFI